MLAHIDICRLIKIMPQEGLQQTTVHSARSMASRGAINIVNWTQYHSDPAAVQHSGMGPNHSKQGVSTSLSRASLRRCFPDFSKHKTTELLV